LERLRFAGANLVSRVFAPLKHVFSMGAIFNIQLHGCFLRSSMPAAASSSQQQQLAASSQHPAASSRSFQSWEWNDCFGAGSADSNTRSQQYGFPIPSLRSKKHGLQGLPVQSLRRRSNFD
jgi:hypothetical protein